MQQWTIKEIGTGYAVLHNGTPTARRHDTEEAALSNALRRATTAAQHSGAKVVEIEGGYAVDSAPLTSAQKQRQRRERLKAAAQMAGYATIDQLAAAILAGDVRIVKN